MGKKLLNKYYSYTDHSELYHIAMRMFLLIQLILSADLIPSLAVLHPSHKLTYFAQAGWLDEWCATAEDIVQAEFEYAYAEIKIIDANEAPLVRNIFRTFSATLTSLVNCQELDTSQLDNIFDALPELSAPSKVALYDELTCYLSEPTEHTLDPIRWWVEKKAIYPRLSRMVLDYLCIPGKCCIFCRVLF
jgi:hypothetical protein